MVLVLRSEKGSPLTPNEVDDNFTFLKGLIDSFIAPAGVSVQNITVSGNQMTVHLSDGSTRGPFTLPTATMKWLPEYIPGASLHTLDIFSIEGDGVYMVLYDHTAPDPFDPFLNDGGQPAYQKIFGFEITPNSTIPVNEYVDGDRIIDGDDSGAHVRMEAPGPASVLLTYDEFSGYPTGFHFTVKAAGVGPYTIAFDSAEVPTDLAGTTDAPVGFLNLPTGKSAVIADNGVVWLVKVGANEFDVWGELV